MANMRKGASVMIRAAVIGGTGVYDPTMLTNVREDEIETPFGMVSFRRGQYQNTEVAFLARHGSGHTVPPHLINYRANIAALRILGVQWVLATTAVGSLNPSMQPGHIVLCDQFLDFTKGRPSTFFDGGDAGVVHTDFTEPYCPDIRMILTHGGQELGIDVHPTGVYVCTEGPRFETPAEIRMFSQLGGDLVGMTNVPEVVLAREASLCYATMSMVTNFAAGISPQPLTHEEVLEVMAANAERIRKLVMFFLEHLPQTSSCKCNANYSSMSTLLKTQPQGGV